MRTNLNTSASLFARIVEVPFSFRFANDIRWSKMEQDRLSNKRSDRLIPRCDVHAKHSVHCRLMRLTVNWKPF